MHRKKHPHKYTDADANEFSCTLIITTNYLHKIKDFSVKSATSVGSCTMCPYANDIKFTLHTVTSLLDKPLQAVAMYCPKTQVLHGWHDTEFVLVLLNVFRDARL